MSKIKVRQPIEHIPTFEVFVINGTELIRKLGDLHLTTPMGMLDYNYYYTNLEGWGKVLQNLVFNSNLYQKDKFDCPINADLAYALGLFFADGSCNLRSKGYAGANWNLVNTKPELLERCINPFRNEWGINFTIKTYPSEAKGQATNYGVRNEALYHLETAVGKGNNRTSIRGKFVEDFRQMFYWNNIKQVPTFIADTGNIAIKAFLEGVIDGDAYKKQSHLYTYRRVAVIGLVQLMDAIGWGYSVYPDKRKPRNFIIRYNSKTENLTQVNACENYALKAMNICSERYGLNAFGLVIGNTELGRHGFNIFYHGDGFLLWEPNVGFPFSGSAFEIGEYGYFPQLVLL